MVVEIGPHIEWNWDGQRLVALQADRLLLLDVRERTRIDIPLPRTAEWFVGLAVNPAGVALGWPEDDHRALRVELLEVPQATAP